MPATSNFGITFPCEGSAISLADFQSFATTTEAALASTDTTSTLVTSPPFGRGNVNPAVAQGVKTTLAFTVGGVTTRGLTAGAASYTVITSGLYFVSLVLQNVNQNPTMTSRQVTLQRNGVDQYLHKQSTDGTLFPDIHLSGLINVLAGDTLTATDLWTSSGAILNNELGSFSAVLIAIP